MNERIRELAEHVGMTKGQELKIVASGVGVGRSIKMNERIEELAKEAGLKVNPDGEIGPAFFGSVDAGYRKFAELIVRECCDVLYDNELGGYQVNHVLKEHFGVEE